jgi:hypothetical protein
VPFCKFIIFGEAKQQVIKNTIGVRETLVTKRISIALLPCQLFLQQTKPASHGIKIVFLINEPQYPMCGRFVLNANPETLAAPFNLSGALELAPSWNIAPSLNIATITADTAGSL